MASRDTALSLLLTSLTLVSVRGNTIESISRNTIDSYQTIESCNLPNFDDLEEALVSDGATNFVEAIEELIGDNNPSMQDLQGMANNISGGELPQYLRDQNIVVVLANYTGNYSYSYNNSGDYLGTTYGAQHSEGSSGTFTLYSFNTIQGAAGTFKYNVGQSIFSRGRYCRAGDNSLTWQGFTQGALLWRMPSGLYVPYGTWIGGTKGRASFDGKFEQSLRTLSIMNTTTYYSKNVAHGSGEEGETHFDLASLTGGTNGTLSYSATLPAEENVVLSTLTTTLRNPDKKCTGHAFSRIDTILDMQNPLSDSSIHNIFMEMYSTFAVYLP